MGIAYRRTARSVSPLADATDHRLGSALRARRPTDADASMDRCADADGERLLYTVQEAAHQLHIGRTLAYQQAERYLATNGREGIPAIKIGNCLRVPRPGLLGSGVHRAGRLPVRARVLHPRSVAAIEPSTADRDAAHRAASRWLPPPDGRRSSSGDRSPKRAQGSRTGRRADSAEQLRLLPSE